MEFFELLQSLVCVCFKEFGHDGDNYQVFDGAAEDRCHLACYCFKLHDGFSGRVVSALDQFSYANLFAALCSTCFALGSKQGSCWENVVVTAFLKLLV